VAIEPSRRVDFEAQFVPVEPRFSISFEPSATRTRVIFRGDSRNRCAHAVSVRGRQDRWAELEASPAP